MKMTNIQKFNPIIRSIDSKLLSGKKQNNKNSTLLVPNKFSQKNA